MSVLPDLDGHDHRVGLRDQRRAVVDEEIVAAVLRPQIDLRLPADAGQRLAADGRQRAVLRVAAVAAPERLTELRPGRGGNGECQQCDDAESSQRRTDQGG